MKLNALVGIGPCFEFLTFQDIAPLGGALLFLMFGLD